MKFGLFVSAKSASVDSDIDSETLIGLHELKEGGVNYILLVDNGGGIKGLDRFANEIMPSIH